MLLFFFTVNNYSYISLFGVSYQMTASTTGILLASRKLRQTNFRHRCFEKEELFFDSWMYFW